MIKMKNIDFAYQEKSILSNLNLEVKCGEILTIVGPNGSGKSTILKNISKLLKPSSGEIFIDGKSINTLSSKNFSKTVATLGQHHISPGDFTVTDLISYGRIPHKAWYQAIGNKDKEIVDWVIEKMNLQTYKDKPVSQLSGGERQRAWIGMALAQSPKILLLDEPTTYLDICHQLEILDLVEELNQTLKITVVMVLHDLNQASRYSHRLCVMQNGSIVALGCPKKVICPHLLRKVYRVNAEVYNDCNQKCPHIRPLGVIKNKELS